jgi:WD40 repeat protein
MAFSADDRSLAVVLNSTTTEGNRILIYKWSAPSTAGKVSKLLCQCEIPKPSEVARVSFHPVDRTILIVSGTHGLLKQYIFQEDTSSLTPSEFAYSGIPVQMAASYSYSDHCFTPDTNHLLACTKSGEILAFALYDLT